MHNFQQNKAILNLIHIATLIFRVVIPYLLTKIFQEFTNFECSNLGTPWETEGCTPTPYPSLDKLEFTVVKISLVIF